MATYSAIICLILGLAMICIVDSKAFSKRDLVNFKKLQNRNITDLRNTKTHNRNGVSRSLPHGNQIGANKAGVITYKIELNKIDSEGQQSPKNNVKEQKPQQVKPTWLARPPGPDSKIGRKDQQASPNIVKKRNPDDYYPTWSAPTWSEPTGTGSGPCYD